MYGRGGGGGGGVQVKFGGIFKFLGGERGDLSFFTMKRGVVYSVL